MLGECSGTLRVGPCLRVVLAFVVSALDYVYEATRSGCTRSGGRRTGSLCTPCWCPATCPVRSRWTLLGPCGFGVPHLCTCMYLRHVREFLRAMDYRSMIVRENVRALWLSGAWRGRDGLDQELLEHALRELSMDVHVPPAARAAPTERTVEVCAGGRVLLVADGALLATPEGDDSGWGRLVVDDRGVLATVHSGVSTVSSSPWTAKWAHKLDAWDLAASLGVPLSEVQYAAGDCTPATLGLNGGTPSDCPWVDHIRLAFAEDPGSHHPDMYVQA